MFTVTVHKMLLFKKKIYLVWSTKKGKTYCVHLMPNLQDIKTNFKVSQSFSSLNNS